MAAILTEVTHRPPVRIVEELGIEKLSRRVADRGRSSALRDVIAPQFGPRVIAAYVETAGAPFALHLRRLVRPLGELIVVDREAHVSGDVVRRSEAQCRSVDLAGVEVVPGSVDAVNAQEGIAAELDAVACRVLVGRRRLQRSVETRAISRVGGRYPVGVAGATDGIKPVEENLQSLVCRNELAVRCADRIHDRTGVGIDEIAWIPRGLRRGEDVAAIGDLGHITGECRGDLVPPVALEVIHEAKARAPVAVIRDQIPVGILRFVLVVAYADVEVQP